MPDDTELGSCTPDVVSIDIENEASYQLVKRKDIGAAIAHRRVWGRPHESLKNSWFSTRFAKLFQASKGDSTYGFDCTQRATQSLSKRSFVSPLLCRPFQNRLCLLLSSKPFARLPKRLEIHAQSLSVSAKQRFHDPATVDSIHFWLSPSEAK